jgi:hypothetical protein
VPSVSTDSCTRDMRACCREERLFYTRMIAANDAFKSKYSEDDIALPSGSRPRVAATVEAHDATKSMLQDEADTRRKLADSKAALEKERQSLLVRC